MNLINYYVIYKLYDKRRKILSSMIKSLQSTLGFYDTLKFVVGIKKTIFFLELS